MTEHTGELVIPLAAPGWPTRASSSLGIAVLVVITSAATWIAMEPSRPPHEAWDQLASRLHAGFFFVVLLGTFLWMSMRRRPHVIVVSEKEVLLPRSRYSPKARPVALSSIRTVTWSRPLLAPRLTIDVVRSPAFFYSSGWFASPADADRLAEALRERVRSKVGGAGALAEMQRRERVAESIAGIRPVMTLGLLVVATAAFLVQLGYPEGFAIRGKAALGAAHHIAVARDGQLYRLVSTMFLHGFVLHFVLNAVALLLVGRQAEQLLGTWRAAVVLLLGGLAASVAATFGTKTITVGMSGIVFAALGAIALLNAARREELSPPQLWAPVLIAITAAAFVYLEVITVRSSTTGHVAGLVAGAAITACMLPGLDLARPDARPGLVIRSLAVVLGLVYVIGLCQAGLGAWRAL